MFAKVRAQDGELFANIVSLRFLLKQFKSSITPL